MEIIQIITTYLRNNRRITVAGLGTFIAKEGGDGLVFSEFLKEDDGVLRGLLVSEGMSELAAAGAVDRFVFELRNELEEGSGEFVVEGFGCFYLTVDKLVAFDYLADNKPIGSIKQRVDALLAEDAEQAERVAELKAEAIAVGGESKAEINAQEVKVSEEDVEPESAKSVMQECVSEEVNFEPKKEQNAAPKRAEQYVAPKKKRFDFWLVVPVLVTIFAVFVLMFGFYTQWRTGELVLPDEINEILLKLFS